MKEKRTRIDFSKHELIVTKTEETVVYFLKVPNTYYDCIKFINTNGIMAVTGDYSNWIFCREFHPNPKEGVSMQYWLEKLINSSCQKPKTYDSESTEEEIKEKIAELESEEGEDHEEYLEYLNECLRLTDDELDYTYYAYRESPSFLDAESVIYNKKVDYHFLAICDGFDEICSRMKIEEEKLEKV